MSVLKGIDFVTFLPKVMKQTLNLTKASTLSTVFSVQSILRNWEVSVSRHARLRELFLYVDTQEKYGRSLLMGELPWVKLDYLGYSTD